MTKRFQHIPNLRKRVDPPPILYRYFHTSLIFLQIGVIPYYRTHNLVTDPLKADTGNDSEPIDIAKIEDTLKLTEDLLQSKSIVPPNLPSDTENPPEAEDLDNLNLFNSDTLDNSSKDIPASIGMNIPPPADLENEPSILSTVDPLGLNADSLGKPSIRISFRQMSG